MEKQQPPAKLQAFPVELMEQIFQSTVEGIMITNENMQITHVNNAFETVTGYKSSEVLGKFPSILQSGKQDADFYKVMWSEIRTKGFWKGEIWNRRKDGEVYPENLAIYSVIDATGTLTNYYGIFSDISFEKETEKELEELSQNDFLTNIANRHAFHELLFDKVNYSTESHAILFIDLDRFKQINDTLGNEIGDLILKEVATRINSLVGPADIFGRYGSDEFIFSRSNIAYQKDAAVLAKEITKLFNKPFFVCGSEVYISVSIGISLFPQDGKQIGKLIYKADKAMYFAKQNGRNQYAFYFEELKKDSKIEIIMEAELRKAIQKKDFFIQYQPKIDLTKHEIIGVEALVRWKNDQLGFVSPAEFIPIAEDTGLIIPLSEVILEKVCLDILEARSRGKIHILPVSINIASLHFQQDDFIERINSILMQYNCSPQLLELELTERTVMKDSVDIVSKLVKLKGMGFKISIDDFGTGYSSLSYLNRFPLNYLKIDRSFVQQITNLQDKQAIVEAIILMAHRLRIKVIAEGVETEDQAKLLKEMGCDIIQGFYYSKPLAINELLDFIELWEIYKQERNI
ncbi:diguanylate cyclase/phosphodiesterase with PAS/PAC sensor(s) [Psychrobacillus sp. OK028]|uniref:putative bifunctional diguanylate cyclase/phosphodiesterase n=1 Tax=Psychrobacillus sp. OK028 TaxID=1884359 RepID=UPI000891A594|nr:EAL domain-containing protein [Psychrobacillus sp. OK028]SDN03543.1 diguanylate cyclase/phosphodiesterase with PAS/PAC sensor(s) [Psychrobacillus sp. OK028]